MKVFILAGGKGTRLWPLSRERYAKQFLRLIEDKELLEATYERILNLTDPENIITITNKAYYLYVRHICSKFSREMEENIICEPIGKNTAPSIAIACRYVIDKMKGSLDEVSFVFPSDHLIDPVEKFIEYMKIGEEVAKNGYITIFGIKPNRPETGYGYIKSGENYGKFSTVERFVEKPKLEVAKRYLEEGCYLWNSGIFAFKISVFLEELERYQPEIYRIISNGYEFAVKNFNNMPSISIDYGVLEKSKRVAVVPLTDIFWSDIGSWDAVYEIKEKDENGNVIIGDVVSLDTKNSLIFSNDRLVAAIGVEDIIVVETDDVVLITKRGNGQAVKDLIEKLKEEKREEVVNHTEMYEYWGKYKTIESGDGYKIRRLFIRPGNFLEADDYKNNSRHWLILKGIAELETQNKRYKLREGDSIHIEDGNYHKIKNISSLPLELIEIQREKSKYN